MAKRHFLHLYTVEIGLVGRHAMSFEELNTLSKSADFFDLTGRFLKSLEKKSFIDKKNSTLIETDKVVISTAHRKIYGGLSAGTFGHQGKVHNSQSGKKVIFGKHEAPSFDQFFEIYIPTTGKTAVLLLHSFGNNGCKTIFEKAFYHFLDNNKMQDFSLRIKPIDMDYKKEASSFYEHFKILGIKRTVYKYSNPTDRLQKKGPDLVQETNLKLIRRTKESLIPFGLFKKADDPLKPIKKHFKSYISGRDPQGSNYAVTIDLDGQTQTVRLDRRITFEMRFDITDEYFSNIGEKHFSILKMRKICNRYLEHAIEKITSI